MSSIITANRIDLNTLIPGANGNLGTLADINSAPDGKNNSDWDFPVETGELVTPGGRASGVFGVIRTDTGECVGQYRKGDTMLPNKSLIQAFEEGMFKLGLTWERKIHVYGNGARMEAKYDLNGLDMDIAGERHSPGFYVRNSYDGSWKVSGFTMVRRLVCLNGAIGTSKAFAINSRHKAELDLSDVVARIESAMDGNKQSVEYINNMTKIGLNDSQVLNVLGNVAALSKGKFSLKAARLTYANWANPTQDEKPLGDTMYRLFQSGTRYGRELERVGKASAASASMWEFGQMLTLAANPGIGKWAKGAMDQLLASPVEQYSLLKESRAGRPRKSAPIVDAEIVNN